MSGPGFIIDGGSLSRGLGVRWDLGVEFEKIRVGRYARKLKHWIHLESDTPSSSCGTCSYTTVTSNFVFTPTGTNDSNKSEMVHPLLLPLLMTISLRSISLPLLTKNPSTEPIYRTSVNLTSVFVSSGGVSKSILRYFSSSVSHWCPYLSSRSPCFLLPHLRI